MFLYPYPHPVHFTEVSTAWSTAQQQQSNERLTFTAASSGTSPTSKLLELGHIGESGTYAEVSVDEKPSIGTDHVTVGVGQQQPISYADQFGKPEPCPNCQELIPQSELIQHIRAHMGPRRCEICNYEAPTKHHLREHMNTHTGLKPYKCVYCEKSFAAKNSLRVHTMYLHTKVRSHQCRFCEQRFVTTSERKSHELVHTDKCPICSMSFRLRGHLRQHMKVHSGSSARFKGQRR